LATLSTKPTHGPQEQAVFAAMRGLDTKLSHCAIGFGSCDALDLEIEDLIEVRPDAKATTSYPFVTLEWARQWPCEEVWKARKRD
jgi:hypothetical protein